MNRGLTALQKSTAAAPMNIISHANMDLYKTLKASNNIVLRNTSLLMRHYIIMGLIIGFFLLTPPKRWHFPVFFPPKESA